MPVKMSVDPERLKAAKPQPAGWYKLKLVGFKPKQSSKKDSVNYNAQFEVLNPAGPEFQKMVFATLNQKMATQIQDVVHGLGFPLEADGNLPGEWIVAPDDPDNVEKYQYKGPLIGRTMEAELAVTKFQNNPERNEIRQVRCVVKDCVSKFPDIRHSVNMIGKS